MANKKISQLTSMGTVGIGNDDYFVTAENLGAGNYATVKSTPLQVSEYVLNPIAATQISGENKNVYFDNNDNWDTASNTVTQNPYLQVRVSDGKLVTGSGIGNAVGGDNMGNGVATTDVNMQNKNITGVHSINFHGGANTLIEYNNNIGFMFDLKVQAAQDLTLSGYRHVNINGQAINVANTPFSGNVNVTGGNLDIDPDYKLIVNEIEGKGESTGGDEAVLSINGAFRSVPHDFGPSSVGTLYTVDWRDSNIQYLSSNNVGNVNFTNAVGGQTLTLYVRNSSGGDLTPNFRSGIGVDNLVRWGGDDGDDPVIKGGKTNVYTFVNINQRIFASAITGYVY
jgi:hypothetical protein